MSDLALPTVPRAAQLGLLGLRLLLAAFFAFMAVKNLRGDAQMAADFARWGYADWFRLATAWMQLGGAAALLLGPTAFVGAALLAGVLCGALATHALHDAPATLLSPALFLGLLTPILLAYRPAFLR